MTRTLNQITDLLQRGWEWFSYGGMSLLSKRGRMFSVSFKKSGYTVRRYRQRKVED